MENIKLYHLNASRENLLGNGSIGRYIFLTGSDERAKTISMKFKNRKILPHPRQHNLYLGKLCSPYGSIEVASVSTGMGGPSADIIINELVMLGAKRLLRVGTAGSLQPERVCAGDIVIASAAVRDDKASWDYIYPEYPALASLEYMAAAKKTTAHERGVHFGIVHSKSSLYARELKHSFLQENEKYMDSMRLAGVLASEMECAQLFILSSLSPSTAPVLSGAVLAVVGDRSAFSSDEKQVQDGIQKSLDISIGITWQMALQDGVI